MSNTNLSVDSLKRAIVVAEQIEKLQGELAALLGNRPTVQSIPSPKAVAPKAKGGKRTMSPEARERIAAAQRARWAKTNQTKASAPVAAKAAAAPQKKGAITPEGRAKLAAAMKARWAAKRKGSPAPNTPATSAKTVVAKPAAGKNVKRVISPEARAKMIAGAKRRWAVKKGK